LQKKLYLIMAIAAALAAAVGLLVIHGIRRTGWPGLMLAGTLLTSILLFTDRSVDREVLFAAAGAGPVLTILGLLGAAGWLMPHFRAAGLAVVGLTLGAPLIGVTLFGLRPWQVASAAVGIAGAAGATALVLALRRLPVPEPPAPLTTAAGILAAALQVGPIVLLYLALDPATLSASLVDEFDRWSQLLGISGLTIFALAIGIAAFMGSKALGAALTAGLVLYGVSAPLSQVVYDSRMVGVLIAVAGAAAGVAALATPWPGWIAGGCGAVLGIVTLVVLADEGSRPGEIGTPLSYVLLLLVMMTVVTTIGAVAGIIGHRSQIPVAIGAVAVTIQVGLDEATALVRHSMFAGENQAAYLALVAAGGGIALIFAAALVIALHSAKETQDQAELSPVAR
jgi:hypothetical protein